MHALPLDFQAVDLPLGCSKGCLVFRLASGKDPAVLFGGLPSFFQLRFPLGELGSEGSEGLPLLVQRVLVSRQALMAVAELLPGGLQGVPDPV